MLLDLIAYSALAVLASAQYPGVCPTDGTTLNGVTSDSVPICCPVPSDGIACVADASITTASAAVTCTLAPSWAEYDFALLTGTALKIQLGGGQGASQAFVDNEGSTCNSVSGCKGGIGALLTSDYTYAAGDILRFNVGIGFGSGGGYTSMESESGDQRAFAAGGGSASIWNHGSAADVSVVGDYVVVFQQNSPCACFPHTADFTSGKNGVASLNGGGDGGSGLKGGNAGVECEAACLTTPGVNPYSGGAGGESSPNGVLGFTSVSPGSSLGAAYASIAYVTSCGCGNGYTPNPANSKLCICAAPNVVVDGMCGPALTVPVTLPVTPVTPPATKNTTDPVVLPNSNDIPVVPSNTMDPISSLPPTSDVLPSSSTPSSSATPISITPVTPGSGTPTTSADADCPTCVDYAPPAIISPTVKTAVAQGATASNLVISGASSVSIELASIVGALLFSLLWI